MKYSRCVDLLESERACTHLRMALKNLRSFILFVFWIVRIQSQSTCACIWAIYRRRVIDNKPPLTVSIRAPRFLGVSFCKRLREIIQGLVVDLS